MRVSIVRTKPNNNECDRAEHYQTLGCMTAVTFFTIYNTWDHYDYDYHWILGFLTFISTIATPLFFVVAGYLDGQSRHGTAGSWVKLKSLVIVFLFWITIYYLWEPYQRGYLSSPGSCLRLW